MLAERVSGDEKAQADTKAPGCLLNKLRPEGIIQFIPEGHNLVNLERGHFVFPRKCSTKAARASQPSVNERAPRPPLTACAARRSSSKARGRYTHWLCGPGFRLPARA